MKTDDKIIEVFCKVDDFCKTFSEQLKTRQIKNKQKKRNGAFTMSESEVITIAICFRLGGFRNFKHFYMNYVCLHLKGYFPQTVSYNRFVELMQSTLLPMAIYLKTQCLGQCTGISFIDSTPLRVCHIKRERSHKTFKNLAAKGQCSIGWFFGFKLHIVINEKGEILDFMLTNGNVDNRQPLLGSNLLKKIFGKLYGDKGYISHSLFERLFIDGIHLVTKLRKNMKNTLMHMSDKIMLRKRALIESVNDELKNICQIEHSRHRSLENFLNNLMSGLIAYSFLPKKPSINIFQTIENTLVLA
jgi:Transposase DDE domain